jgi:predicted lipid-binding transport protein (Tim44 family)
MNELNPDTRRLVDLAREARTPDEDDKLRVARRLAVPLAASAALGTAVGGAKASTTLLGSLGAKIAAVVALGAVGTAVVGSQPGSEQPSPAAAPSATSQKAPPAPEAVEPAPRAPEAPAVTDPPSEPRAAPKPNAAPSGVHGSKPTDDLAQEAALLHQAQAAWRAGQSARALELANQHAARFPRSQLANERDVLRVLSLCKLGQVQAAKQVGARLLRTAKGSPWYQSVAGSCAAE